jgi:peptidoglycan biosynthesis protein MviN/MurJ (putative lipid II flippase)
VSRCITQINLLINTNIASGGEGVISSLAYADRIYQLPLGVVGTDASQLDGVTFEARPGVLAGR